MHDCAPAFGIQVSFPVNQQLARLRTAIRGSVMQSGALRTAIKNIRSEFQKRNTKQNQQQISNINAHMFLAFKSAFP
jgi:hypothetical protein